MTVDRSPISIPISRVGVATRTFGASGAVVSDALNWSSTRRRVVLSSRLVCSREMIVRGVVEE